MQRLIQDAFMHVCVCWTQLAYEGHKVKSESEKKIIIKFLKNQDCEGHNVFAVTLEFAEFGNLAWRDQRILPRQIAEILKFETKQCTLCREREVQYKNWSFFFLSRLLEWALMAPWNTRSLSQKQLSTHERGSSSYLLYAIWFIFTRSWWFDRLLCSLILLSIFSDQHTGAIWVEKMQKKWIKRVEEIALKSVLKSLEQNAVQWLPIFNWAFLFLAHFQTNLGQCANQIV